ncbi:MAG: hypothetical protein LUG12_12850 [Erysipelotrichaceae bacterium]|nr:hypothetical protein [Erysipelotrichaceae bacterium]
MYWDEVNYDKLIYPFKKIINKTIISKNYTFEEKEILLNYLRSFKALEGVIGLSINDPITEDLPDSDICSSLCIYSYTDGKYKWNDQDIYNLIKYNVAVTDEFLDMVINTEA